MPLFQHAGLEKNIYMIFLPVSFSKNANYFNHIMCNGSVSSSSIVGTKAIKLVHTDFLEG